MTRRHIALIAGGALAVGAASVTATVVAAQDASVEVDDDDQDDAEGPDVAITGADLERASAVALEFTGEGRVSATEIDDEESYYEVEVTLDDGSEVDVQLDEEFNVVGTD